MLGKIISRPLLGCFEPDAALFDWLKEHDPRMQRHLDREKEKGNSTAVLCKESQWRHIFETLELT